MQERKPGARQAMFKNLGFLLKSSKQENDTGPCNLLQPQLPLGGWLIHNSDILFRASFLLSLQCLPSLAHPILQVLLLRRLIFVDYLAHCASLSSIIIRKHNQKLPLAAHRGEHRV